MPLRVNNLEKHYGNLAAVKPISFEIKSGEIFGLLGPNGAGKTSIISCIATLEKPTHGNVEVFGFDVQVQPRQAKLQMGIVPQELIHHGFFNIEEILIFHSGYYGLLKNKERIDYLLHSVGLWEHKDKKVRQLSGGMKRRLLVAKALVHEPKLLILDEPTAGVDIELRESLWEFVNQLKKEGVSILLTTHYLEEAEELCDRVGIINFGHIVRVGETKELIKELTQRQITFVLNENKKIQHPLLIEQEGNKKFFQIPNSLNVGELFEQLNLQLNDVTDLSIREGSLEDAFRSLLDSEHE